ncbi:hypothetical protein SAMN02745111_02430 [Eubacterium uniforme]|uniref:Uncharacterized protein n=1 Tax=Eubacterium uniforme TaxID=39495 RepID=A0A1T4W6I3_9FIRM|nr:DUF3801 domain-containing protein [Eubacterium uniforme]SKA72924.1 hypothetical protein SAMN02745111_02430 [Eubacterium uniforme]
MSDINADLSEVIQVLRFSGEAFKDVALLIKSGSDIAGKTISKSALKALQIRMKLHFYDLSLPVINRPYNSVSIGTMEKITGGNYRIIDIPSEDEKELEDFFKIFKKHKVPFAVLPDLNHGDNHIQIAVNPQDIDKINDICEIYKFNSLQKISEITEEEYYDNASIEEKEDFDKTSSLMAKQVEQQNTKKKEKSEDINIEKDINDLKTASKIERYKTLSNNSQYEKISLDMETLFKSEDENYMFFRVPGSYDYRVGSFLMIAVKKEDIYISNDNKTATTFLHKDSTSVVQRISRGNVKKTEIIHNKKLSNYFTEGWNKFDKENGIKSIKLTKGKNAFNSSTIRRNRK